MSNIRYWTICALWLLTLAVAAWMFRYDTTWREPTIATTLDRWTGNVCIAFVNRPAPMKPACTAE